MRELYRLTPDPENNRDDAIARTRIITWIFAQLTPEQRAELSEDIKNNFPLELTAAEFIKAWKERAVTGIMNGENGVIVGIDLDHPGMGSEAFEWDGIEVFPEFFDEESYGLRLKLTNTSGSGRFLRITMQNIYQDEETETVVQATFNTSESIVETVPLPRLVESARSILMFLREYKG